MYCIPLPGKVPFSYLLHFEMDFIEWRDWECFQKIRLILAHERLEYVRAKLRESNKARYRKNKHYVVLLTDIPEVISRYKIHLPNLPIAIEKAPHYWRGYWVQPPIHISTDASLRYFYQPNTIEELWLQYHHLKPERRLDRVATELWQWRKNSPKKLRI